MPANSAAKPTTETTPHLKRAVESLREAAKSLEYAMSLQPGLKTPLKGVLEATRVAAPTDLHGLGDTLMRTFDLPEDVKTGPPRAAEAVHTSAGEMRNPNPDQA